MSAGIYSTVRSSSNSVDDMVAQFAHTTYSSEVTDNTGDWDVNLRISGERANVVYGFLRDNKISHDRIIFYGKGSAQPIASNETDAGRKMNRRVEVILLQ